MLRMTSQPERPTDEVERRFQALALALFDGAAPLHRLPRQARQLLQIAGAFYLAGKQADSKRPDRTGRDLALAGPLDTLSSDEQAIVASAVAFQREKLHRMREPAFVRLSAGEQATALRLAAILQVADGLNSSTTAELLGVRAAADQTTLLLGGSRGGETADVVPRDALWRETIGQLEVIVREPGQPGEPPAIAEADGEVSAPPDLHISVAQSGQPPLLGGGEPIAEEARRVLRRFFEKLLAREDDVREHDDDPEDVHQMRVATRRLRASLQVVEAVYAPKLVRRYRRELRRIADPLGMVRDRDVFLQHVVAYRDALRDGDGAEMQPLVAAIAEERSQARARLLEELERRRYVKFKRTFATFLTSPGAGLADLPGIGAATRVRDFAGSAIWQRYEQWRAYEVLMAHASDETLHQARIAGKRLRYTLEFFADALGPNVEQALAPLAALQENLGALQDGVVAAQRIRALDLDRRPAIAAYLQAREAERAAHLAELPRLWEKLASATYRRRLSELIVKL